MHSDIQASDTSTPGSTRVRWTPSTEVAASSETTTTRTSLDMTTLFPGGRLTAPWSP